MIFSGEKVETQVNDFNKRMAKYRQKYKYYEYSTVGHEPDYFTLSDVTFSLNTPYDNAIFKLSSLPFMKKNPIRRLPQWG